MCSLANYNFVCKPRNDGYGGVGIYLKKHTRFRQINSDIRLEVIRICTTNLINNINIFSVYAAPSTDISFFQKGYDDLFTIAAQSSGLAVIGGDFNAKSSIWGNNTEDARGVQFTLIAHPTVQHLMPLSLIIVILVLTGPQ